MPHKFNAGRRHKFAAARSRVTNWRDYNEALRRRGDVTVWFDESAARSWRAPRREGPGGQPVYSDVAIEVCLTLRSVFRLPLRQAQGLVRSLLQLMELELPTPDFSTFSRRSKGVKIVQDGSGTDGAITLVVDSTGLRIHRGSGWCADKHGADKIRKSWRKLHIGIDRDSREIVSSLLTTEHIGDETALPDLIAGVDVPVARLLADGAYDGTDVFTALRAKFGPEVEVIIPPPRSAVLGLYNQRDAHIRTIAERGRMVWQAETGYNFRALVEVQIGRWKTVLGDGLKSRSVDTQTAEVQIGAKALNRMTTLGRAAFERVT